MSEVRGCPFIKNWFNGSIRTSFTESYIVGLPHEVAQQGTLGSDVTLHLVGVFINIRCRTMHIGAGLAH